MYYFFRFSKDDEDGYWPVPPEKNDTQVNSGDNVSAEAKSVQADVDSAHDAEDSSAGNEGNAP